MLDKMHGNLFLGGVLLAFLSHFPFHANFSQMSNMTYISLSLSRTIEGAFRLFIAAKKVAFIAKSSVTLSKTTA